MSIATITEAEMTGLGVVSLPTRPNNAAATGGEALSAAELKARFDRLPRFIAERLNALLNATSAVPDLEDFAGGAISELMPTGMFPTTHPAHTLANLFADLLDGTFATYLNVGGTPLTYALAEKADSDVIVSGSAATLLPKDGREYRLGTVESLSISLPASPSDGFTASLVFDSMGGNGDTALDYPAGISWSGDDIVDGMFTVFGDRHYTLLIWYDGAWQAAVRGVSL